MIMIVGDGETKENEEEGLTRFNKVEQLFNKGLTRFNKV